MKCGYPSDRLAMSASASGVIFVQPVLFLFDSARTLLTTSIRSSHSSGSRLKTSRIRVEDLWPVRRELMTAGSPANPRQTLTSLGMTAKGKSKNKEQGQRKNGHGIPCPYGKKSGQHKGGAL